jgi:hypothetical protein
MLRLLRRAIFCAGVIVAASVSLANGASASSQRNAWAAAANQVCARTLRIPSLPANATRAQALAVFEASVRAYSRTLAAQTALREPRSMQESKVLTLERRVLAVHRAVVADLKRLPSNARLAHLSPAQLKSAPVRRLLRDLGTCQVICNELAQQFGAIGAPRCAAGVM